MQAERFDNFELRMIAERIAHAAQNAGKGLLRKKSMADVIEARLREEFDFPTLERRA